MSDVFERMRELADAEERALRPMLLPLCERHGFGRMMQLISGWWRERDPAGAISLGPCYGTLEAEAKKKRARAAKRAVIAESRRA